MIPLRDVIPSRSTPYVTLGLIVLASVMWLYQLTQTPAAMTRLVQSFGLVHEGWNLAAIVTSPVLHASWIHLLGNLWGLWLFGESVEDRLGHAGFAALCLVGTAVATLSHFVPNLSSTAPAVGASGTVATVLGAYVTLYPQSRILALTTTGLSWHVVELPALAIGWVWMLLQFVSLGAIARTRHTHDPAIAAAAYAAAFVAGAAVIVLTGARRTPNSWWDQR